MDLLFFKASANPPIEGTFANKHFSENVCGPLTRKDLTVLQNYVPGEEIVVSLPVANGRELIEYLQKISQVPDVPVMDLSFLEVEEESTKRTRKAT